MAKTINSSDSNIVAYTNLIEYAQTLKHYLISCPERSEQEQRVKELIEPVVGVTERLMCQFAIKRYLSDLAYRRKAVFDFNYLFASFKSAFNYVHCESIWFNYGVARKLKEQIEPFGDTILIKQDWESEGKDYHIEYIQVTYGKDNTFTPVDWINMRAEQIRKDNEWWHSAWRKGEDKRIDLRS